jgi:hypothetical protein
VTTIDDLIDYIFTQDKTSPLAQEFAGWARESRRYKAFAETYKDKIRRKYRLVQDDGGLKDLRSELETAALLLHEDRFTLEYEKYASLKQRGPDFTVTFRTHTPFNVEVRRMRSSELKDGNASSNTTKLITIVCDKIGQMPAGMVNLLWLSAEREIEETDLNDTLKTLRLQAEGKNEPFFNARGFASAADFLKQYRNLSGILLRRGGGSTIWLNAIARHRLPPDIVLALQRLPT